MERRGRRGCRPARPGGRLPVAGEGGISHAVPFSMPVQTCRISKAAARGVLLAGLVALLPVFASCAVPINLVKLNKEIPRAAMPIAIAAGIDTLDDAQTKRRLQQLL